LETFTKNFHAVLCKFFGSFIAEVEDLQGSEPFSVPKERVYRFTRDITAFEVKTDCP